MTHSTNSFPPSGGGFHYLTIIVIILAVLLFAGCTRTEVERVGIPVEVPAWRTIPANLLDCRKPDLSQYNSATLTNRQVARIMTAQEAELSNCVADVRAIRSIQAEIAAQQASSPE